VLIFIDRAAPADTNTFSNSTFNFEGTIYGATQKLFFTGNAVATALNINIVSNVLEFAGGGTLNLTHSFPTGSAIKQVSMVE
jgi:hypothetical protein